MIRDIAPRLAEAGKIKIGALGAERTSASGRTWRAPRKLDHFLVTKTSRDNAGDLEVDRVIMDALPKDEDGKCRAIPVQLPFDGVEENFATSYVLYAGRSLGCSGDGVVAIRRIDRKGEKLRDPERVRCTCPALEKGKCKPNGRLSVIIDLPGVRTLGAAHVWRTTGVVSISGTLASLRSMHAALKGQLSGVPMWLKMREIQHAKGNFWSCHLEMRESDFGTRAAIGPSNRAPLAELGTESPDEVDDLEAEFYAPAVGGEM